MLPDVPAARFAAAAANGQGRVLLDDRRTVTSGLEGRLPHYCRLLSAQVQGTAESRLKLDDPSSEFIPSFQILEDMLPLTEKISISWPVSEHFVQVRGTTFRTASVPSLLAL